MTRKIIFLLSVLLVSLSAEAESRIDKLLRNLHDQEFSICICYSSPWRLEECSGELHTMYRECHRYGSRHGGT